MGSPSFSHPLTNPEQEDQRPLQPGDLHQLASLTALLLRCPRRLSLRPGLRYWAFARLSLEPRPPETPTPPQSPGSQSHAVEHEGGPDGLGLTGAPSIP